jgi:hypothetical protein
MLKPPAEELKTQQQNFKIRSCSLSVLSPCQSRIYGILNATVPAIVH